jgi:hypothetical protein
LIPVDEVLLTWAEEVVCMSEEQAEAIRYLLKVLGLYNPPSVISLDIPDQFRYRDPELVELIKKRYDERKNGWPAKSVGTTLTWSPSSTDDPKQKSTLNF